MIDRITLAVSDMDRMKQFYEAILPVKFYDQKLSNYALYIATVGGLEIILCPKELAGVRATINTIQLRFAISNVSRAFENGLAMGGTAITQPQKRGRAQHASLKDPDGNSLEIIEYFEG